MWWRMRAGQAAAEMPFLDHLEELRGRILWSFGALLVGAVIGYVLVTRFDVLGLLIEPMEPYLEDGKLGYLTPFAPFFITLKMAVAIGALLAAPIIIYHAWSFVSPALLPRERRAIVPAFYLGLVLFAAGVALAYFAALPVTLKFTQSFQTESLRQNIIIGEYLAVVLKMLFVFGLVFELPVVVLILSVIGVVDSKMLAAKRRHAIVVNLILASLITPGDFIVLTLFLMVPLVLLYELSVGLARLVERRREKAASETTEWAEAP